MFAMRYTLISVIDEITIKTANVDYRYNLRIQTIDRATQDVLFLTHICQARIINQSMQYRLLLTSILLVLIVFGMPISVLYRHITFDK